MQHIIAGPYRTKVVVIKVFPLLKERRKIEQRLVQDAGLHKVQCYQQSANTPITIQERVDGLKLIVYNGYLYQIWHIYIGIVDELLKVTHQITEKLMVWWNITGIGYGSAANPVLCPIVRFMDVPSLCEPTLRILHYARTRVNSR